MANDDVHDVRDARQAALTRIDVALRSDDPRALNRVVAGLESPSAVLESRISAEGPVFNEEVAG